MADILNLRRARKNKVRAGKASEAQANRAKHGVAKTVRELARARSEKLKQSVASHKLDEKA